MTTHSLPDRFPDDDTGIESPVEVLEITDEHVVLDLPDDVRDADRVIPQDLIEFGNEARSWFLWDMETKQPRAPMTKNGYAGTCAWGRDAVSMDARAGARYGDVAHCIDGHVDDDWWWDDDEDPTELWPMCIVPHADFSPEPGLVFVDLDDVIEPQGDGTGRMTREAWDIIQSLDGYAEVSSSKTGAHVFVRGQVPSKVDGKTVLKELDTGHVEVYGYPANGCVMGTTWLHINETPVAVPHNQDEVGAVIDDLLDEEEMLTDEEQAEQLFDRRKSRVRSGENGSSRSAYYDLDPEPIAHQPPFSTHESNGRGPHPVHGGTSTPDEDSTNFTVDRHDGWKCWAHDDGGGALQLIAVMEGIRDCGDAADVLDDPVDALKVCLAARDKYADLDDERPPTIALKGVCEVQDLDYNESGQLEYSTYKLARDLYGKMQWTGGDQA
ncbi:hypothetical protein [Natrarchaeobius chitinivorans]|uniref:DNA primase/polymerase bifunctional N-terminal domain-containing protein n=1 Tax=Natrarchaeobius chitinivorans TaxID=1679083 RepID=A0A3N6PEM1_NATCH|nr:hypothetical protein [Natrarchaeobius chitinivorans]RQG95775.1 hypothetical protein EA473_06180 [Natrarchaeobius chitinivorans]